MIQNASDTPLDENPGTLPNMQSALLSYFQPLTFTQIVKTVENFNLVETLTDFSFLGVRQPFTAQQLVQKPEGQRAWKWETVHSLPNLSLLPDDIIIFKSVSYRVMQKFDWTEYGYIEYHIVENYT